MQEKEEAKEEEKDQEEEEEVEQQGGEEEAELELAPQCEMALNEVCSGAFFSLFSSPSILFEQAFHFIILSFALAWLRSSI